MLQSKLVFKTRKDAPKDEVSLNAKLLIRAGFIHKDMAGVYSFLPLGLRVLNKIEQIIRDEMNALGAQELHLASLQDKSVWEKTGRFDDAVVDNWFKTKLKNDTELGLAFTHEEPLTNLLKDHIRSFRDLPFSAYQFQTKFRNETRAKSGIMRGREFVMKDLYSFSRNQEEHDTFYEKAKQAYMNIFSKAGLGDRTLVTFASGGVFSKYSHEFQTITPSGEDIIYISKEKNIAVNKEVLSDEVLAELGLKREELVEEKSVEVGNIFSLGTRFSKPLELAYKNEKDELVDVIMGSYGIGVPRLMGTIVETLSDEKGIVWPESVAPFDVHLIALEDKTGETKKIADGLYEKLSRNKEVLYDDREAGVGAKFADADLIGIPKRIVVSPRTIKVGSAEVSERKTGNSVIVKFDEII